MKNKPTKYANKHILCLISKNQHFKRNKVNTYVDINYQYKFLYIKFKLTLSFGENNSKLLTPSSHLFRERKKKT